MRLFAVFLAVILFFCVVPTRAFATLYINEFSSGTSGSDWVEIYNSDSSSVDLSNYIVRDSTSSNKHDLSGSIGGNSFISFDWDNNLNNDGDTIRLLLKSDESMIDQIVYGSSGTAAPSGSATSGRSPDGSANWTILSSSSKGSSNNSATPVPTATPTPTPNPTATPTPTTQAAATNTPTPTKTPTPTPTSKTAPSPTLKGITPTDGEKMKTQTTSAKQNQSGPPLILGAQDEPIFTPTPVPVGGNTVISNKNALSKFLIISGVVIFVITCGILAYLRFKKEKVIEAAGI